MIWTYKIPTVPGFYWCRMHGLEFVTEIKIKDGFPHSYGLYHQGLSVFGTWGSWAGPIPLPTGKLLVHVNHI